MDVLALRLLSLLVFVAAAFSASSSRAANEIAGELIVFNDNGAWSWFEGERAVVDSTKGKILLSSVANGNGPGGARRDGDVDIVAYDLAGYSKERFTIHKHLQPDDHDSAALLILPSGRYLASYSKHARDNSLRYRVSRKPGNIRNWEPEQVFFTAGPTTYSNLCYLSKPNTIFDFHRDTGRGFDPNFLTWNLSNTSGFSYGGHLLTGPEGNAGHSDRPYVRYAGNGVDRIHFLASDHHPRNLISNSVYHGYLQAERVGYGVYRSDGTRLGDLSRGATSPYKASDFTPLLKGDLISPMNDLRMTRAWPTDIKLDRGGNPYVIFTARVDDRDSDHRFFYGQSTRAGWHIHQLAKAGAFLYSSENDYTGLAALDPSNPDLVFISANIDPRTDQALPHHEIFKGTTADAGLTWTWLPITYESSVDNVRPVAPPGAGGSTALLWMRGTYQSYTNYNTRIVGLTKIVPIERIAYSSIH